MQANPHAACDSEHPSLKTVLFFGTFDAGAHPRVRVLAQAIESAGHKVIYCNAKSGISTEERVAALRRPWVFPSLVIRYLLAWRVLIVAARSVDMSEVDVVVVGYLGVLDVHLARRLLNKPLILDQMASLAGTAEDRSLPFAGLLRRIDGWANCSADLVLVDTRQHLPVTGRYKPRTRIVPVGASWEWFDAGEEQGAIGGGGGGVLSVCFFGLFTPLQGAAFIGRAAALLGRRRDICWTLVGHGQDRPRVEALTAGLDQVTWHDWVEDTLLPGFVASHDVCLGIFGDTAKARRVTPNKVYQGAAAGCAVVTSDTKPQREALQDAAVYVPVADAAALAAALEQLADDRTYLGDKRAAAKRRARSAFTPGTIGKLLHPMLDEVIINHHSRTSNA